MKEWTKTLPTLSFSKLDRHLSLNESDSKQRGGGGRKDFKGKFSPKWKTLFFESGDVNFSNWILLSEKNKIMNKKIKCKQNEKKEMFRLLKMCFFGFSVRMCHY
jgi:hypothetical protein